MQNMKNTMKRLTYFLGLFGILFILGGCGTTGENFDESRVDKIINGSTTASEVKHLLGQPLKKGIQNGKTVWIYEYNQYRSIGDDASKDIFITFDDNNIVSSHQLMTSNPE
jgi:outer membrane protein assembly factor BamE (lipoprotein component of BamABCDE complex)